LEGGIYRRSFQAGALELLTGRLKLLSTANSWNDSDRSMSRLEEEHCENLKKTLDFKTKNFKL